MSHRKGEIFKRMRKGFKGTLICTAILAILNSVSLISISANHKTNQLHQKATRMIHEASVHHPKMSVVQIGKLDAKKDFNKFNGEENYGYLFAHPYYFHNTTFTKSYIAQLTQLAKKYDTDPSLDVNVNEIKVLKHYLPIYKSLTKNAKSGFLNGNSTNYIPKHERHNLTYAKGYLLANMYIDDANNIINDEQKVSYRKAPTLSEISNYYTQGNGKVPATVLNTRRKGNIYDNIVNLENQSNKYAWTSNQMKYHTRKVMHSLHMNKSLTKQFKNVLNPWYVDDSGNNLATTKFASSINKEYPYHHSIYYPKNMDGGKSTGQYEGDIINMHDNLQTKKTNKAFRKYMRDYMIYHAGKDCEDTPKNSKSLLKYMNNFTKHYNNKNYKGQNNTPYAQWRLISHKSHKYSDIMYITPQNGWNYYIVKN